MCDKPKRNRHSGGISRNRREDFKWLVSLIRKLRPDLCELFRTNNEVNLEFARWLLFSGQKEYGILAESPDFINIFNGQVKVLGVSPIEALVYLEREDVQGAFPLPAEKSGFRQWFLAHGIDEHDLLDCLDAETRSQYYAVHPEIKPVDKPPASGRPQRRPFGANLIGYAYGQLGIGEDLRMTAKALQSAGVPFSIIDFPPGEDIPQNDMSMAEFVGEDAPHMFNIFCMTAMETGRFYTAKGKSVFADHYNIGYWPWELAKWPAEWRQMTDLVDEVWVSSRHIYDALAPVSPVPVLIMPLAVETDEVASLSRKDFGLPEDAYLFCFSFDLNSSIHRKNPMACLKAFQKAFPCGVPTEKPVGLVIKCHKPKEANKYWEKLKAESGNDPRIHIIEETLSRPDLLALYKACDCYLSLHRAEGFGRGIAEALLLGLQVITTGYSGNVDYCRDNPAAHLASYSLAPVQNGQYPFGEGQKWADVDIEHAAMLARQAVLQENISGAGIQSLVGMKYAGKRYRQRLRYLWENMEMEKQDV